MELPAVWVMHVLAVVSLASEVCGDGVLSVIGRIFLNQGLCGTDACVIWNTGCLLRETGPLHHLQEYGCHCWLEFLLHCAVC